jgi:hypothetical protein
VFHLTEVLLSSVGYNIGNCSTLSLLNHRIGIDKAQVGKSGNFSSDCALATTHISYQVKSHSVYYLFLLFTPKVVILSFLQQADKAVKTQKNTFLE